MRIARREFVTAAAALTANAQRNPRPNILYIMTDQQHAGMLSCAGNRWLQTPAMDSLAASGVRFELAYSGNPVCVPARTSMMTGRYPSHFGIRDNRAPELPREILPAALGHTFRNAGYETVFGGKTHWPRPMTAESIGFEYITRDEREGLAQECETFLRRKHDKPFLLIASFINPHDICYMAIDAHAKATGIPTPLPKSVVERERVAAASGRPEVARNDFFKSLCPPLPANHAATENEPAALGRMGGFRGYVRKHWTAEDWRLHRWVYHRLTEEVDAQIGRVLTALRDTGLESNTVVVFASDHGDMDSSHGFEHKSLPYEESARVPFIVSWKGKTQPRVDREHLIGSTTDLFPTLCDYAGIQPPAGLPGRSIRPVVEGKSARWRDALVIECEGSRTLRTATHKYSIWEGPGTREVLFDMQADPGEMHNLAAVQSQAPRVAGLRRRLESEIAPRIDAFGRDLLTSL
ncbi:MAG: sulfatase-like hydrolase/transferase [Acidobacteria bacterium]|nr:sulfatase-like hydrolase/transferase [Acidobacteriota bacterium]